MPENTVNDPPPIEWTQETLFGYPLLEATLRVGFVTDADHVQALVELRRPDTGELLAMSSWAHRSLSQWEALLDEAVWKLKEQIVIQL